MKSATIEKLGDWPTTPDLLLEMLRANFDDIESIVVSIVRNDKQETYWTQMQKNDLAFHLYCTQRKLSEVINED